MANKIEKGLDYVVSEQEEIHNRRLYVLETEAGSLMEKCKYIETPTYHLSTKGVYKTEKIVSNFIKDEDLTGYVISTFILLGCNLLQDTQLITSTSNLLLQHLYENQPIEKIRQLYKKYGEKDSNLYIGLMLSLLSINRACNEGKVKYQNPEKTYLITTLPNLTKNISLERLAKQQGVLPVGKIEDLAVFTSSENPNSLYKAVMRGRNDRRKAMRNKEENK